jgi:hypothetical protein
VHLSAENYQEILRSLRSDKRLGAERRRNPRVGLRARVTLIALTTDGQQGTPQTVWVRDISDGGIGLVVTRPSKRGALFVIRFKEDPVEHLCLLCQVIQCRPADLVLGAKIIRELTPFEMSEVIARRPLIIDPDEIPALPS